jgi:hypothetical protein
MRTLRTALLCLALCFAGAATLAAQTIPSPYRFIETRHSIGAYAGYLWTEQAIRVDTVDIPFGPQSAPIFGARYGYRVGGPVTLEAALGFAPSERRLFRARTVGSDSTVTRVDDIEDTGETVGMPIGLLEAGARLHLTGERTWNNLAPFVGITGGLIGRLGGRATAEDSIPQQQRFGFGPGFAVGAGAGTDWFLSERFSLRAELRDVLWRLETPLGFRPPSRTTPTVSHSRWGQNIGVTVGGALHF